MSSGYAAFLDQKRTFDPPTGHDVADAVLAGAYPRLFDWQRELVAWDESGEWCASCGCVRAVRARGLPGGER